MANLKQAVVTAAGRVWALREKGFAGGDLLKKHKGSPASNALAQQAQAGCEKCKRIGLAAHVTPCAIQTLSVKGYFAASTFTRAFGVSPNISGAYSASTRLGGKAKSPTLFRRTV